MTQAGNPPSYEHPAGAVTKPSLRPPVTSVPVDASPRPPSGSILCRDAPIPLRSWVGVDTAERRDVARARQWACFGVDERVVPAVGDRGWLSVVCHSLAVALYFLHKRSHTHAADAARTHVGGGGAPARAAGHPTSRDAITAVAAEARLARGRRPPPPPCAVQDTGPCPSFLGWGGAYQPCA